MMGYARLEPAVARVGRTPGMKTISAALFGAPLDPFSHKTRQHIALVAFLAWILREINTEIAHGPCKRVEPEC